MKDIETRHDLEQLMSRFYDRLLADPEVSYIFTDVARIDLAHHLPIIVDFWEQLLFHSSGYKNNVFELHRQLHLKSPLEKKHFTHWLQHLETAIDMDFKGKNAEKVKTSALFIATVMQLKLT